MQRKLLMMIDVKFFELYLKFMQSKKIIQTRQAGFATWGEGLPAVSTICLGVCLLFTRLPTNFSAVQYCGRCNCLWRRHQTLI